MLTSSTFWALRARRSDVARTAASLNKAARVTNYISLGVIASAFPAQAISAVLIRSGKGTVRERELPA